MAEFHIDSSGNVQKWSWSRCSDRFSHVVYTSIHTSLLSCKKPQETQARFVFSAKGDFSSSSVLNLYPESSQQVSGVRSVGRTWGVGVGVGRGLCFCLCFSQMPWPAPVAWVTPALGGQLAVAMLMRRFQSCQRQRLSVKHVSRIYLQTNVLGS